MEKMTITEALAEVRLIEKKIIKQQKIVFENRSRLSHVADPYADAGGGKKAVESAFQSVRDLGKRLADIRISISVANQATMLELNGREMSITGWLAWRREVAPQHLKFMEKLSGAVSKDQEQIENNPPAYKDENGKVLLSEIIYNVDKSNLDKEIISFDETLSILDGKLSLLNATVVVEL